VDGGFTFHDPTLNIALRVRPRVALNHLNAFDDDPFLIGNNNQDAACLTSILSTKHCDFIILLDRNYRWH